MNAIRMNAALLIKTSQIYKKKKSKGKTTQALDWYLPMMSHLETLKMTKFFPNTQKLIQKKNPSIHKTIENYSKVATKL